MGIARERKGRRSGRGSRRRLGPGASPRARYAGRGAEARPGGARGGADPGRGERSLEAGRRHGAAASFLPPPPGQPTESAASEREGDWEEAEWEHASILLG